MLLPMFGSGNVVVAAVAPVAGYLGVENGEGCGCEDVAVDVVAVVFGVWHCWRS